MLDALDGLANVNSFCCAYGTAGGEAELDDTDEAESSDICRTCDDDNRLDADDNADVGVSSCMLMLPLLLSLRPLLVH